ncbi:MAG: hypothetical protein M3454_05940 [Actinomycetota bacterium]|nr:hypothetical protein [Actinomycetota bacterium]
MSGDVARLWGPQSGYWVHVKSPSPLYMVDGDFALYHRCDRPGCDPDAHSKAFDEAVKPFGDCDDVVAWCAAGDAGALDHVDDLICHDGVCGRWAGCIFRADLDAAKDGDDLLHDASLNALAQGFIGVYGRAPERFGGNPEIEP